MYRDGVPDEDKKRLYQHARLGPPEMDAINNLKFLGQDVTKVSCCHKYYLYRSLTEKLGQDNKSKRKQLFKQTMMDEAYDISRYQPAIKLMLEVRHFPHIERHVSTPFSLQEHFQGKLDQKAFPYIGAPPPPPTAAKAANNGAPAPTSLRSARPRWTSGAKVKTSQEPRQRAIVFVAGGLTYSEIRSAYVVSQANNKDVFIGAFRPYPFTSMPLLTVL